MHTFPSAGLTIRPTFSSSELQRGESIPFEFELTNTGVGHRWPSSSPYDKQQLSVHFLDQNEKPVIKPLYVYIESEYERTSRLENSSQQTPSEQDSASVTDGAENKNDANRAANNVVVPINSAVALSVYQITKKKMVSTPLRSIAFQEQMLINGDFILPRKTKPGIVRIELRHHSGTDLRTLKELRFNVR